MDDRLKMPPVRDYGFYQRRKHDKWSAVETPVLEVPVADSHAHVHMLPEPAWELARCAANGVDFVCMIVDPSEDGPRPYDELDDWIASAADEAPVGAQIPDVRIATGVHPHNAKLYDDAIEATLIERLAGPHVVALGEIGLDYYYDLSPRDVQRTVFRRQIQLAAQLDLPIALHLRSGEDPKLAPAHREAFEILGEEGFPPQNTLVHCCTLPPDELLPWVKAGCYIAYGGAITFKNNGDAREGIKLVPVDRLLLETDTPYMAPTPMRGTACTPAHVVFNAVALAEILGVAPGDERARLINQLHDNTLAFYRVG